MLQHAFAFQRTAVTPQNFATVFLPAFICYYAMAVLVQIPRTRLHRAALLPVLLWFCFHANRSLDFSLGDPRYVYLNQGLALTMFTMAARSMIWAMARQPYSRLPMCKSGSGTCTKHNAGTHEDCTTLSSAMRNAWNLFLDMRGLGWSGPLKGLNPTPYFRVESRSTFALLSFCQFFMLEVAFDVIRRVVVSLGPDTFGAAEGGTIFDQSLPLPQRYLKSTVITMLLGASSYLIIDALYHLHAGLYVILFHQHPSQWPSLFECPLLSTSLTCLWGRRWHQLFREIFVLLGGAPMERYFGRVGMVMGSFAVSGILHVVGLHGMDRGTYTLEVMGFFLMQGVGVIMEGVWKKATGKRVGGFIGWLWTLFWLVLWGTAFAEAWGRSGLLAAEFGPEAYRPTTLMMKLVSQTNVVHT